MESTENYVPIHTTDHKKIMARSTFQDFLAQFDAGQLVRVHRSYAVNPTYIDSIDATHITARESRIPVSKTERDGVMKLFGLS